MGKKDITKMRIKDRDKLHSLKLSVLEKQITACEVLRESYTNKIGSIKCSLCAASKGTCDDCPWRYIKGMLCSDWTIKGITRVRRDPRKHARQATLRAAALTEWIGIINAEITRRSKDGKNRITKTGKELTQD